jgi:gluconokinase
MFLVVMGVAGSGKTTLGQALGRRLGWEFRDADGFHPAANIAKMKAGTPLQDEDRWPWLRAIRSHMESEQAAGRSGIIACSALKETYRDTLGRGEPWVRFVHVNGSRDLIEGRMRAREGHFMPVSLLDSQFATLESPADAITLDISQSPEALVEEVLRRIA